MDDLDSRLLSQLQSNARESVANLARLLGVTRPTVQERMRRLERRGIITGYTVRFHPEHAARQVQAYVMISVEPKSQARCTAQLQMIDELQSLHSISGSYDLIALFNCETTSQLEKRIDQAAALEGVQSTLTSVVLSEKFSR